MDIGMNGPFEGVVAYPGVVSPLKLRLVGNISGKGAVWLKNALRELAAEPTPEGRTACEALEEYAAFDAAVAVHAVTMSRNAFESIGERAAYVAFGVDMFYRFTVAAREDRIIVFVVVLQN